MFNDISDRILKRRKYIKNYKNKKILKYGFNTCLLAMSPVLISMSVVAHTAKFILSKDSDDYDDDESTEDEKESKTFLDL